jgi:hypothetical protein
MFFTKWGYSVPALERANLDGTGREIIVNQKVIIPLSKSWLNKK